jgi:glycosyltransferase involved in cell wall biosynthesis
MLGLPVAAYSVAGVSEVVADQQTGLLVRPGDVASLARAAAALLADPNRRLEMAREARARCRDLFDIGRIAPRYLEVYREVATA